MKKVISYTLLMALLICSVFNVPVAAKEASEQQVKDVEAEAVVSDDFDSEHVHFVSRKSNGNTEKWEYYVEDNGKKYLMKDEITTTDNGYSIHNVTQEVNSADTEEHYYLVNSDTKMISEETITDDKIETEKYSIDSLLKASSSSNAKSVSGTINLKKKKAVVSIVAAAIAAAVAASSAGAFATVAAVIVSTCISEGKSYCPDTIYYCGKRTVSRSTGKIYYRYNCKFYKNKSKKKYYGSAKWSRRWGH